MYMVTMAARISSSVLFSEDWNASAAPWKLVCTLKGRPIPFSAARIAFTASQRGPRGEVERNSRRGKLGKMVDHQWPRPFDHVRDAAQPNLLRRRRAAGRLLQARSLCGDRARLPDRRDRDGLHGR